MQYVNGYWKDNKETFEGYLVVDENDGVDNDDVFFVMSLEEIKEAIALGEAGPYDFVITSYE